MTGEIEATIEDVVMAGSNKIPPILVKFQNGLLKDEATENMKCGLFYDQKLKSTVLAMSNNRMVYKGYRPNLDRELTYTMLAIHNKKTGKVRLIQAERWNVTPVLESQLEEKNDDETDKIAILNKQFGSKKMKRRTEQYEKMKINPDSVKDKLEQTVIGIDLNKTDLESNAQDEFGGMLPPCNKEALLVSEVYNVYDVVPEDVLKTLYGAVDEILEKEIPLEPVFYADLINKFKNKENYVHNISILLYLEAIIKYFKVPWKVVKKQKFEICPYSVKVVEHIIETYSNGRLRSDFIYDKATVHCIVLGLILSDYLLDLNKLFNMLKIGFKKNFTLDKLKTLARYAYAVPTKDRNDFVILKLPLPEAAPKVMSKRKKNR